MGAYLLGIDVGTSACKAALFDSAGRAVKQAKADYPVYYPRPGWVEQEPDDWWAGVCQAVRELFADGAIAPGQVAGVGIDGQSWSAIPVDASGAALCRTPIWMDTRAGEVCARLDGARLFACSGNPLKPAYTLPKVLWYKQQAPAIYRWAVKILGSNAYIGFKLTGAMTQDLSQGYGYGCFDMRRGVYDYDLCREAGMDPALLPELVACHQIIGAVTPEAARLCGLKAGTPVVAGGLDAACGTLGAGVLRAGETQEQGGQAGGMSICIERYAADPRLILGFHVAPGRWLLQGGTVGGGGVMKWFAEQFADAERERARKEGGSMFDYLNAEAAAIPPASEGVVFLPYMAGERSPIWDEKATGVYYGLNYAKTKAHMLRAAMEGVAFSLRHNLEVARAAGAEVGEMLAVGGSANSVLWTQIKSDVTGKVIRVPEADTATTLGAAMLSGVATGVYKDFEEAVARTKRIVRTHTPNAENAPAYARAYRIYRELYERIKGL